ncbi:glucose inhibited division protein a [Holotrichia oblita]|nr:glucose inhibited division protein a [Holotrichia oblita]
MEDTIVQISTAPAAGAVAIIRLSGLKSVDIVKKIFKNKQFKNNPESHRIYYGKIIDGEHEIDEVLVSVMLAPKSYTMEDVVEINCHGGLKVTQKIVSLVLKCGARLAEPGEFTKRAFLNGRIDLSQAEAVCDLINSSTELARKTSYNQLNGHLKEKIEKLRDTVLSMIAGIEVSIDYPEVEINTENDVKQKCNEILSEILDLIQTADYGKIIHNGIETAIIGRPNVGKSSLLNAILKENRAIVTEIPGTTRDILQEYVNINDIVLKVTDTAGIHDTQDVVEKLGVSRAKDYLEKAELVLMVLDGSEFLTSEDIGILHLIKNKKSIIIVNKGDLPLKIEIDKLKKMIGDNPLVTISARMNHGIELIYSCIKDMFLNGDIVVNTEFSLRVAGRRYYRQDFFGILPWKVKGRDVVMDKCEDKYYEAGETDVAVIGGGHAGCEAALAAARMGMKTIMFAISLDSIAMMPCNPDIGGTSKGHLVREIDALGGEMGKNIDKTLIQIRMLNTGKGPAVHSLRAQADKSKYTLEMKRTLENTQNLRIKQAEIIDIEPVGEKLYVTTRLGARYCCGAVILASGTYLDARCLYGSTIIQSEPSGLKGSEFLSGTLEKLNIKLMRFKTGTPARIDKRSIDFSKMAEQPGEYEGYAFSFENSGKAQHENQISCYLTYTNEVTHKIIRDNLHKAPMYSGLIEGTGTRYCPSIEDKVVRFADKESHQVFIEPEGRDTNEMYVQGVSTSLPEDVQIQLYRSIPGLENCEIMRPAYAIEYDCIDATQLDLSLMFKNIPGLFSAGQVNGSSGYEEAAAQGLMAGINAARFVRKEESIIIGRDEGYIGVLIDDLVIKGTKEPYRMMTSRAEYRLLLRQDNADERLSKIGYDCGLISEERYRKLLEKLKLIEKEIIRVENTVIPPTDAVNAFLCKNESTPITTGIKLSELIKRPELNYNMLFEIDADRRALTDGEILTGREALVDREASADRGASADKEASADREASTDKETLDTAAFYVEVYEQVNIRVKYDGYIKRQLQQIEKFKKMENNKLPQDFDYNSLNGLRLEARQKLSQIKPENLGQAMRITGVSPADISVLMVYLKLNRNGYKA